MSRLDRMTDGECDRIWTTLIETTDALMDTLICIRDYGEDPSRFTETEEIQIQLAENVEHWEFVLEKARKVVGDENLSDTFGVFHN
jgi:hypothetical protein